MIAIRRFYALVGWCALAGLAGLPAGCGTSQPAPSTFQDSGTTADGSGNGGSGGAGNRVDSSATGGNVIIIIGDDASVRDTAVVVPDAEGDTLRSYCGDGVIGLGETCDDGNPTPGDGCSGICAVEPGYSCPAPGQPCIYSVTAVCGNRRIEGLEACDDGNVTDADGCSAGCAVETGWACDVPGQPCTRVQTTRCGDGRVNAGEQCDDGGNVGGDGCSATCALESGWSCPQPGAACTRNEFCGDGVIQASRSEVCDDGNTVPGDGCSGVCTAEAGYTCATAGQLCTRIWVCGNGRVDPGEACDDSNTVPADGCSSDCTLVEPGFTCPRAVDGTGGACVAVPANVCGDAVLGPRERCDDGNTTGGDGCSSTCAVEAGWTCPAAGQACTHIAFCGDGAVGLDAGEQCDDGNVVAGDGCSSLCQLEPNFACPTPGQPCVSTVVCGDGRVNGLEQCDDRNVVPGDGCNASCQVEPGWLCPVAGARCVAKLCSDSIIAGAEKCDDGNTSSGDGCSATCKIEPGYACDTTVAPSVCHVTSCGDGNPEGTEQCDDGNSRPFDGCYKCLKDPQCTNGVCQSVCGDGQRFGGEACDDGNTAGGDGCSSLCAVEPGFTCTDILDTPPDSLNLPVLLRDFVGQGRTLNGHAAHIDFNQLGGNGILGIVESALGPNGRPVYACPGSSHGVNSPNCLVDNNPGHLSALSGNPSRPNMSNAANFAQWYTDIPGTSPGTVTGVNITLSDELVLTRRIAGASAGAYRYDSAEAHDNGAGTSIDFFDPLHSKGWVAASFESSAPCSPDRNVSFTSETHFWFQYEGGERFDFSGDDDTWVFVNGRLAVDLGGLHVRHDGFFTLDADTDGTGPDTADGTAVWGSPDMPGVPGAGVSLNFNLTQGGIYEVVMFQAERNQCGSNFTVTLRNFNKPKSRCQSTCGDGIVASDEVCDDGINDGSYGSCLPGCQGRGGYCGDATVQAPETCDDGVNLAIYGGTTPQCGPNCRRAPYCGDGVSSNGEQCDDGAANADTYGHCTTACRLGDRCGDGVLNGPEQCDHGVSNGSSGDSCAIDCTLKCGNASLDPGEQCDNGTALNTGAYGTCRPDCALGPRCGDGFRNGSEQCDDGRNDGSYGTCKANCTLADYCGDGRLTAPPEGCDLGAQNSATAYGPNQCTTACKPAPYCGDRAVDGAAGEVCDDGVNSGQPGSCTPNCKGFVPLTTCGDGTVQPPEQCDNAAQNGAAGSGCDSHCRRTCGNGIRDVGEQCDDGVNNGSYGTCKSDCSFSGYCGDGVQNGPEQCDQGSNNAPISSAYGPGVCTAVCIYAPFCGDGRVQSQFGEECDGAADCEANCRRTMVH